MPYNVPARGPPTKHALQCGAAVSDQVTTTDSPMLSAPIGKLGRGSTLLNSSHMLSRLQKACGRMGVAVERRQESR